MTRQVEHRKQQIADNASAEHEPTAPMHQVALNSHATCAAIALREFDGPVLTLDRARHAFLDDSGTRILFALHGGELHLLTVVSDGRSVERTVCGRVVVVVWHVLCVAMYVGVWYVLCVVLAVGVWYVLCVVVWLLTCGTFCVW